MYRNNSDTAVCLAFYNLEIMLVYVNILTFEVKKL